MTANRHEIINTFSRICGVHYVEILGRNKCRRPTRARQMAAFFLRESGLPLMKAGAMLGDMHHATVLHSVRLVASKPELYEPHLSQIRAALQ